MEIGDWSLLEVTGVALFGGWFFLSLLGQIWPRDSALRRIPIGGLIPDWRFFAPNPAVEDRIVIYRFKSARDEVGPVETLRLSPGGALRWIWNPGTRRHKALFDLTDGLHRLADKLNNGEERHDFPDALMVTEPYLVLLNLVSTQFPRSKSGLVQFGIIHRGWPDREELAFLSRWHTLDT